MKMPHLHPLAAPRGGRGWRVLLAGIGLAFVASAHAQVEVRDDRGEKVLLAAPPQRIVSLLPSLTESVCALGACDRLVGTDRFSNWPEQVRALPRLGGLEDAQIERIVALRPDVVLVSSAARVVDRLEALGVRVVVLESRDHADVKRSLTTIARLLGRPAQAERVWAAIDADTRAAAARVPAALRGRRVYFEVDATPYAAGAGSFIGETLAQLGLVNALPAELGPFPKLNPEVLLRLQPDIVMADQAGLASMPARPGWAALHALREGRTCGFPGPRYELLVRPGPRMGEAAGVIADCLVGLAARAPKER
jgi:iron complex transport system substrate-binding protein